MAASEHGTHWPLKALTDQQAGDLCQKRGKMPVSVVRPSAWLETCLAMGLRSWRRVGRLEQTTASRSCSASARLEISYDAVDLFKRRSQIFRDLTRKRDEPFYRGKLAAAQHWIRAELPRAAHLADLCRTGEDSYGTIRADWF